MSIVRSILVVVFILSTVVALSLGWAFYFGICKDGCAGSMAFTLFLPAVIIATLSALCLYGISKRAQCSEKEIS